MKKTTINHLTAMAGAALLALALLVPVPTRASSHMDAPLITLDPAANTTDVYAFLHNRESDGAKVLAVSLAVYPFEEPGEGPNNFRFDDNVLYEIHVARGAGLTTGAANLSYQFRFTTTYKKQDTILQAFLGVIQNVDDANQNLVQTYTVTKVEGGVSTQLGTGTVPPNNQGIATPLYNTGNNGENPAKPGVSALAQLDKYTTQSLATLSGGYRSFAGQREDGFYADIQAVFDLLNFRTGKDTFDSQGGFNLHEMALEIPVSDLGGDQQVVGVYATTSRRTLRVLSEGPTSTDPVNSGAFVQVGRQGNPLFNEGLVALQDKDLYNRTQPTADATLFDKYARTPELAKLINAIVFAGQPPVAPETNRTDLVAIFIPDLIKVDLSTAEARLAGGGTNFAANPDDAGFSRLGIFGTPPDVLTSTVQPGFFGNMTVPGGWPNGRRFGDDVLDIAVTAILSDLRDPVNPIVRSADGIDNVSRNDSVFSKIFPYAATPHNGRNHAHHNIFAAGAGFGSRFRNLSARGLVQTGDNQLIGGIIVGENGNKKVLVRGIGPSLVNQNVPNPVADPVLQIWQGGTMLAENDDWKTGGQQAAIEATTIPPTNDAEAAILIDLAPGAYTMTVRSKDGSAGIGLVEAYEIE